jgi:cytochrome c-type biogenesis protein CcmE
MKRRHKRIVFIVCCLAALALAIALVGTALNSNLQFFVTPTEVAAKQGPGNKTIRVGGLVEVGSIQREGTLTRFTITDTANKVPVVYNGITPDLFRDGRGCVVVGRMGSDGVFHADTVMAKHDENYMPPEAGQAIDKAKTSKTLVER